MLKGIFIITMMGFGVSESEPMTHEYLVKEIPTEVEGTLYTSQLYYENDTVQVVGKTFVVIKSLK